jgi:hypothetical protein
MPYHVGVLVDQGILNIRYYGTVDAKERLQSLDRVLGMCKEEGIRRVLVDYKDVKSPSIAMETEILSSTLAGADLPETLRVALIFPADLHREKDTGAFSRKPSLEGRIFSSRAAGCLWLEEC